MPEAAKRSQADRRPPRSSRKQRRTESSHSRRGWIRLVYFCLASLWGFLVGIATLSIGSSRALETSPVAVVKMSAAVLLAVVGGVVVARAYREAFRRDRE